MTEKNLAAIRAAALALVRQAELAGVVVTIATVPGVPLAMRNYRMEVDVRAGRGGAPVAADLSEQDAGLLEQGASMLEALAGDERNRGNDSAAMGAECSAHAVRRLAVALTDAMRWRHGEKHGFPDQWQQLHPVVRPPYWIVDGIDDQFSSPGEAIDAHMKAVATKGGAA